MYNNNIINDNFNSIITLSVFSFLKTGNFMYDSLIYSIIVTSIGYFLNKLYSFKFTRGFNRLSSHLLLDLFYKKNSFVFEGKVCFQTVCFVSTISETSLFSDNFKAIWNYIIKNIENNNSIYEIKEIPANPKLKNVYKNNTSSYLYMVTQEASFILDNNIYAKTNITHDENQDDKEKIHTKTDKIKITIYSYVYSMNYLKQYIDNITSNYLETIQNYRLNKRFIYSLCKTKIDTDNETNLDCWKEDIFETSRSFKNIFFDGKSKLIEKIDFFLNNREWYYDKGIPYTLGIGLHGPPGTGKTSFIKALATYTNRHIVSFSLKVVKTKYQLEQFFFENTYNSDNEKGSITFDKKIVVIEDIDCIGDIILDRNKTNNNTKKSKNNFDTKDSNVISDVITAMSEISKTEGCENSFLKNIDPPITLDDILNLWDGIRETPGRILIITSNHYNKLDTALIRPGRIDISHELGNASHNTICEMFYHFFKTNIDKSNLKKIKEYFYSPADLTNIYISTRKEKDFIERLLMNKRP
jgi:DNA polymerase III delta prime subunit